MVPNQRTVIVGIHVIVRVTRSSQVKAVLIQRRCEYRDEACICSFARTVVGYTKFYSLCCFWPDLLALEKIAAR